MILATIRTGLELPTVNNCSSTNIFVITEAVGFLIDEIEGRWHWESRGPVVQDIYCSEDGFDTRSAAITDAVEFLAEVAAHIERISSAGFIEYPISDHKVTIIEATESYGSIEAVVRVLFDSESINAHIKLAYGILNVEQTTEPASTSCADICRFIAVNVEAVTAHIEAVIRLS